MLTDSDLTAVVADPPARRRSRRRQFTEVETRRYADSTGPRTRACAVCGGPITYYPRRPDDRPPRTSAVNDSERWAHDRVDDWIHNPHRPVPEGTKGEDRIDD